MVHHIFAFSSLLLCIVSAVSALPAPRPHELACAPPRVQSLGPGGIPLCSLQPDTTARTRERRPSKDLSDLQKPQSKTPKKHVKSRITRGEPRAEIPAEERTLVPRARFHGPLTQKKAGKVAERKENRKLGKQQKHAATVANALQKQKMPPYGINPATGALRKPVEADVAKKAWADKQNAQARKQGRQTAYNALKPADRAAHHAASAARQAATRQHHIAQNTKAKNRQQRINTKATNSANRKAANRAAAAMARTAYASAQGKPARGATYTSPQGRPYNGKDVRQALFHSELATAKGGVGYNAGTGKASKTKDKLPKNFENRKNLSNNLVPLAGQKPLPNNPLKEFPILHGKRMGHDGRKPTPSDARIVTQKDSQGRTELKGLIGHPPNSDDHVSF